MAEQDKCSKCGFSFSGKSTELTRASHAGMAEPECQYAARLRRQLKQAREALAKQSAMMQQTIDIICDPDGGLYARLDTSDARIRKLAKFATTQREELATAQAKIEFLEEEMATPNDEAVRNLTDQLDTATLEINRMANQLATAKAENKKPNPLEEKFWKDIYADWARIAPDVAAECPDPSRVWMLRWLSGMLHSWEQLRAEKEQLHGLVRRAFEEGFTAGMDEYRTRRGGTTWRESKSRKAAKAAKEKP